MLGSGRFGTELEAGRCCPTAGPRVEGTGKKRREGEGGRTRETGFRKVASGVWWRIVLNPTN